MCRSTSETPRRNGFKRPLFIEAATQSDNGTNGRTSIRSKQSSSTIVCATVAVKHLSRDAANFVIVIPGEFASGPNVAHREEGDPRKAQVLSVEEHVLYEKIRIAAVIEITAEISLLLGVHHVDVLRVFEVIAKGLASLDCGGSEGRGRGR